MNEHIEQLRQVIARAALFGAAHASWRTSDGLSATILAATYPPACQTCVGWGQVIEGEYGNEPAPYIDRRDPPQVQPCPDCPTIEAILLAGVVALRGDA